MRGELSLFHCQTLVPALHTSSLPVNTPRARLRAVKIVMCGFQKIMMDSGLINRCSPQSPPPPTNSRGVQRSGNSWAHHHPQCGAIFPLNYSKRQGCVEVIGRASKSGRYKWEPRSVWPWTSQFITWTSFNPQILMEQLHHCARCWGDSWTQNRPHLWYLELTVQWESQNYLHKPARYAH